MKKEFYHSQLLSCRKIPRLFISGNIIYQLSLPLTTFWNENEKLFRLDRLQHEILEQEKELELMQDNEELEINVEDLKNERDGIKSKVSY